jgi:hypothetical protein
MNCTPENSITTAVLVTDVLPEPLSFAIHTAPQR